MYFTLFYIVDKIRIIWYAILQGWPARTDLRAAQCVNKYGRAEMKKKVTLI